MQGVYQDPNGIFRIQFPEDWTPLDREQVILGDLVLVRESWNVHLGVFAYPRNHFGLALSPLQILDAAQPTPSRGVEIRVGEDGPLPIAGLQGWERFRTFVPAQDNYVKTRVYETVAIAERWVFAFSVNAIPEDLRPNIDDARAIMNTLELVA